MLNQSTSFAPQVKQGYHECEILGKGPEAAESELQWQACEKNRGHKKFIPIKEFASKHMPQELRDQQTFDTFKTIANLTVRLRVRYTSENRPNDDPISQYRSTDYLRTGSGLITAVDAGQGTCNHCFECNSYGGQKFWWVYLRTARHVAYDNREAKATKVDLFCDDDISVRDGSMKSLQGVDLEMFNAEDDFCVMRCVVHDESLAKQIQNYTHAANLGMNFKMTYFPMWGRSEFLNHFVVLVISHPHGKPKMVTVGKMKRIEVKPSEEKDNAYILESYGPVFFEYATPTCPGCSGAPLIQLCRPIPIVIRNGDMRSTTSRPICADGWVHSGTSTPGRDATCKLCLWPQRCSNQVNYSCVVNNFDPHWKLVK
ncbi:hypothetical protein ElyMa_000897100 [Elysia marginata]|uniref:Peptidase S1 domain-containing protein n=1 Tax=Elysia marginata TaxID=1093978 RepID=A0AAV4HAH2_9GAST|nr:hypothetical protein ElyMa_000897100 [Elysia marginata]